jgi:hypothetical protein
MAAGPFVASGDGVLVKVDGTPTSLTTGSGTMSRITGQFYQVTAEAQRCINPAATLTLRNNGVTIASTSIEYIDFFNGVVKFAASLTIADPSHITVHGGQYLPLVTLGSTKSFSFKSDRSLLDRSVFGNLDKRVLASVAGFSMSLGSLSFLDVGSDSLESLATSLGSATRRVVRLEVLQDGSDGTNGGFALTAYGYLKSADTSASPDALVETGIECSGASFLTPASGSGPLPVSWSFYDMAAGMYL